MSALLSRAEEKYRELLKGAVADDVHPYIATVQGAWEVVQAFLNETSLEKYAMEQFLLWHPLQEDPLYMPMMQMLESASMYKLLVRSMTNYHREASKSSLAEQNWQAVKASFGGLTTYDGIPQFTVKYYEYLIGEKMNVGAEGLAKLSKAAWEAVAEGGINRNVQRLLLNQQDALALQQSDPRGSYAKFNTALAEYRAVRETCQWEDVDARKIGLIYCYWQQIKSAEVRYPLSTRPTELVASSQEIQLLRSRYPRICAS